MLTKKANMFCDHYLGFLYGGKIETVKQKPVNLTKPWGWVYVGKALLVTKIIQCVMKQQNRTVFQGEVKFAYLEISSQNERSTQCQTGGPL